MVYILKGLSRFEPKGTRGEKETDLRLQVFSVSENDNKGNNQKKTSTLSRCERNCLLYIFAVTQKAQCNFFPPFNYGSWNAFVWSQINKKRIQTKILCKSNGENKTARKRREIKTACFANVFDCFAMRQSQTNTLENITSGTSREWQIQNRSRCDRRSESDANAPLAGSRWSRQQGALAVIEKSTNDNNEHRARRPILSNTPHHWPCTRCRARPNRDRNNKIPRRFGDAAQKSTV